MTQTELAEATDIPYQTIGHWERNSTSPKFDSVEKIAKALGITVAELISPDSCQSDAATARNNLYKKIDDELRKTEESDIEMYRAWMRVAPMVQKILSEESSAAAPATRRKPMSSEAKRRWLRINDTIEKVTITLLTARWPGARYILMSRMDSMLCFSFGGRWRQNTNLNKKRQIPGQPMRCPGITYCGKFYGGILPHGLFSRLRERMDAPQ